MNYTTIRANIIFFTLFFGTILSGRSQTVTITADDIVNSVTPGSTVDTMYSSLGGESIIILKTGGSTSPNNITYPQGAPLNVIPKSHTDKIEGLHLGRTSGVNGTGYVFGYGQLRTENYKLEISSSIQDMSFIVGALNNNLDGVEQIVIEDVLNGSVSVLEDASFSIAIDYDDHRSDPIIFDTVSRTIKGQDFPKVCGYNESALFKISCTVPFNTIVFKREDIENNRPDAEPTGQNLTNGVTLTDFTLHYPTVLPIHLLHFNTSRQHNKIGITWSLFNTEAPIKYFLQYKEKGEEWINLLEIESGKGVTTSAFSHLNAPKAELYYRIVEVNFEHKYQVVSPIRDVDNRNKSAFSIYPTICASHFLIENPLEEQHAVKVQDFWGKTVIFIELQESSRKTIDVTFLSAGFYFVSIVNRYGVKIFERKIYKQ